jgi:hypothetical protein
VTHAFESVLHLFYEPETDTGAVERLLTSLALGPLRLGHALVAGSHRRRDDECECCTSPGDTHKVRKLMRAGSLDRTMAPGPRSRPSRSSCC